MMKLEHNFNLGIEFFKKINNIRDSPVSYSLELEQYKESFKGNDFYLAKRSVLPTQEGIKALNDLIEHFSNKKPIRFLKMEKALNMICEDFCNQAKSFDDMSELNNTYNFEKQFKKYGKVNRGRYMNIMFNLLTNDPVKNSFLFLSCDGDESREYRDLFTVDPNISQIGIHVVHFDKEASPLALVLLVDDFTPDPLYQNDAKLNNILGTSNSKSDNSTNNQQTKSVNFSNDKVKNDNKKPTEKEPEVIMVDGSKDPELNLAKGIKKVEKSQRIIKEGLVEYIVTKTVTYMEDGEIKTQISKDKLL